MQSNLGEKGYLFPVSLPGGMRATGARIRQVRSSLVCKLRLGPGAVVRIGKR